MLEYRAHFRRSTDHATGLRNVFTAVPADVAYAADEVHWRKDGVPILTNEGERVTGPVYVAPLPQREFPTPNIVDGIDTTDYWEGENITAWATGPDVEIRRTAYVRFGHLGTELT